MIGEGSRSSLIGAMFILALLAAIAACSPSFKERDIAAMRAMFRVPESAAVIGYSGHPEKSGTFGREGLDIAATFELSDRQFRTYYESTRAENVWTPVPFPGRSPSVEKDYSRKSLQWRSLPIALDEINQTAAAWIRENAKVAGLPDQGRYICHASEYEVPKGKAPRDAVFRRWSCEEYSGRPLYIGLAALDVRNRRLHTSYTAYY